MTELTESAEIGTATVVPSRRRFTTFARTHRRDRRDRGQGARGRMRGRRAFAILTIYLLLLAGFALMAEKLVESNYTTGFGSYSAFAGAAIGQGIFAALLMLMTLQVVFLAPSSTSGSISLERKKHTLELLIATPISSLAIVVGKLLSALVYVFLLIAASLPLMAVVCLFGWRRARGRPARLHRADRGRLVARLVRASLLEPREADDSGATAITIFGVLAVSVGTIFVLGFWQAMGRFDEQGPDRGCSAIRSPAIVAYLNPFVAQADVMCADRGDLGGGWCSTVNSLVPTDNAIVFGQEPAPMPAPVLIDGKGVIQDDVAFADRGGGHGCSADRPCPGTAIRRAA